MRRILRWLCAQVGMVAEALLGTLETMAELDLIHARARLQHRLRMSAPQFNQEGRLVLRAARHPLLEALFRGDPAIVSPPQLAARSPPPPIADATATGPRDRPLGSIDAASLDAAAARVYRSPREPRS